MKADALSRYDPTLGLKTIAVAEAIEKHYARAKDATQLQDAIRAKLAAQAEFVAWWDHQADKAQGQRNDQPRRRSATKSQAGANGLPDRSVIHRWRERLSDPDAFEATYQAACARYLTIIELTGRDGASGAEHVNYNSGEIEWFTPPAYIDAARRVLGDIDLDPASTTEANAVIQAKQFYTRADNALDHEWHGRVWMNPPYAQSLIAPFCEKLADSLARGTVTAAIVLVNNATDTGWFRTVAEHASAICFPTGRIQFWYPDRPSVTGLQGQAVLCLQADIPLFCETFAAFGLVWVKP